jgi:hypothetical protein
VLQLTCFADSGAQQGTAKMPLGEQAAHFQIPSSGCVGQQLALSIGRGEGEIRSLWIDQ